VPGRGGPPVASPTGQGGFGSRLINRAMSAQLGGTLRRDRAEDGVIVTPKMDRQSLEA
jgi:two-component sensor histidine kinase